MDGVMENIDECEDEWTDGEEGKGIRFADR